MATHLLSIAIVYATGAMITFARFYRGKPLGGCPRKHYVYAAIWPVWWLVVVGVGGTIDAIDDAMFGSDKRANFSLGIGLFTAGYYLAQYWHDCDGLVACSGVAMKTASMLFAPISVFFWGWYVLA